MHRAAAATQWMSADTCIHEPTNGANGRMKEALVRSGEVEKSALAIRNCRCGRCEPCAMSAATFQVEGSIERQDQHVSGASGWAGNTCLWRLDGCAERCPLADAMCVSDHD